MANYEINKNDRDRLHALADDFDIFGVTFEVKAIVDLEIEKDKRTSQIAAGVIDYVENLELFDDYDEFFFTVKYKSFTQDENTLSIHTFVFDISIDGIEN